MTEGRPREDTGRRQPSISQGKRYQKKPTCQSLDLRRLGAKIVRKQIGAVETFQSVVLSYGSPSKLKLTLFKLFQTLSNCPATLCRAQEGWCSFWSSQPIVWPLGANVTFRQATECLSEWRLLPLGDCVCGWTRTKLYVCVVSYRIDQQNFSFWKWI